MRKRRCCALRLSFMLLLASAIGCGLNQKKYDRMFPPGSTREQMITKFGRPLWTVQRPAENPTDQAWLKAVTKDHDWMHPSVFLQQIAEVEKQSGSKVGSLDAFYAPHNRSFLQRLDVFQAYTDLVFYDSSLKVLSSRPLEYYAYGD